MAKYLTEPKCAADGNFESVQCNPSGKKCWCVDENGKMVGWKMGARDKLNCSTSDEGTGKKRGVRAVSHGRRKRLRCSHLTQMQTQAQVKLKSQA